MIKPTAVLLYLFQGVRGSAIEACEKHNPCQNGGICISTDSGPICECAFIDFVGAFCETGQSLTNRYFRSDSRRNDYLTGQMRDRQKFFIHFHDVCFRERQFCWPSAVFYDSSYSYSQGQSQATDQSRTNELLAKRPNCLFRLTVG